MKLSFPAHVFAAVAFASTISTYVEANCTGITFPKTIAGDTCDKAKLIAAGVTQACLDAVYGAANVDAGVAKLCAAVEMPFGEISHEFPDYQFDKNYMDGGTEWNDLTEGSPTTKIAAMGGRIKRVKDNVASKTRFAWPKYDAVNDALNLFDGQYDATGYMSNFHLQDSCKLRVAMCCFVAARVEGGANSNLDNADVCYHDIRDSYKSAHVRRGWEVFPLDETSTACVGFAWGPEGSVSAKYKANALFQTSYVNTYDNLFVKGIPGAPMCACIEQMPVVTTASCINVSVTGAESVSITLGSKTNADGTISPTLDASISAAVTYGNCAGANLKDHYATLSTVEEQKALAKRLVGTCAVPAQKFLNSRYFVTGSKSKTDVAGWTTVVGERSLYAPQIGETEFRKLIEKKVSGKYPLIWRQCESCWNPDHKNIYYKRITDWCPASDMDALDMFMNNWTDKCNNMAAGDFKLYKSLQDAIDDKNAWTFCNYNDSGIGFPRDCGPTVAVTDQWNSYDPRRNYGSAQHHVFRVQKI